MLFLLPEKCQYLSFNRCLQLQINGNNIQIGLCKCNFYLFPAFIFGFRLHIFALQFFKEKTTKNGGFKGFKQRSEISC